jgi:hypothetical protein
MLASIAVACALRGIKVSTDWLALGFMCLFVGVGLSVIYLDQWLTTRREARRRNQARPWRKLR